MQRLIALFLILGVIRAGSAQESIYDLLPNKACPEMEVSGEPERYVGDDLFSLINGGAEHYHEYGFAEVLAANITVHGGNALKLEIYDMGSPEASWGIYTMTTTSSAKHIDIGDAGRIGTGFMQFIKANYMVYMYFEEVEESELRRVSECITQKLDSHTKPFLMDAVAFYESPEKTYYFKGNLGLSNIYNFHYKDVFGYYEGAAAIYPDLKAIVLNYTDEASCSENYLDARDFFLNSGKYHDQISLRGSFHMKDRKEQQIDCYLENSFLIVFIYTGENDLNKFREGIADQITRH